MSLTRRAPANFTFCRDILITKVRLSLVAMGIRFACHACQKSLNIKSELAGKRGVCPQCGTRFRIPSGNSAYSSPLIDTGLALTSAPGSAMVANPSPRSVPQPVVPHPVASANGNGMPATQSLLDDPTAVWYVRPPSGGQYGPATGDVLRAWITEQRVTSTSLIWRDGWPQWRSANEALSEFGATTSPVTTPLKNISRPAATAVPVPMSPTLRGDATIGMQKSKKTYQRFIVVGTLAAICMTLLGVLIFLMQS